jgi:tetratricopeptide (TPR) repeat protein
LHRLAGKAAYYLGEYKSAAEQFEMAIKVNDKVLPAWEGLAFTQLGSGAIPAALGTYLKLVRRPCSAPESAHQVMLICLRYLCLQHSFLGTPATVPHARTLILLQSMFVSALERPFS